MNEIARRYHMAKHPLFEMQNCGYELTFGFSMIALDLFIAVLAP